MTMLLVLQVTGVMGEACMIGRPRQNHEHLLLQTDRLESMTFDLKIKADGSTCLAHLSGPN